MALLLRLLFYAFLFTTNCSKVSHYFKSSNTLSLLNFFLASKTLSFSNLRAFSLNGLMSLLLVTINSTTSLVTRPFTKLLLWTWLNFSTTKSLIPLETCLSFEHCSFLTICSPMWSQRVGKLQLLGILELQGNNFLGRIPI